MPLMGVRKKYQGTPRGAALALGHDRGGAQLARRSTAPSRPSCPGCSRTTARPTRSSSWSAAARTRPTGSTRSRWRERGPGARAMTHRSPPWCWPAAAAADDPVAALRASRTNVSRRSGGVPMLVRVVQALAASPRIGRIVVALEDPALLDQLPALRPLIARVRCSLLPSGRDARASACATRSTSCRIRLPLLVTTADHALLDARDGRRISARRRARPGPISSPAWRRPRRSGPPIRTPSAPICAFATSATPAPTCSPLLHAGGAARGRVLAPGRAGRKRPWRLVRAFGWRPLLAYLLGRLTLDEAMARASNVIGARVAAVVLPDRRGRDRRRQAGGSGSGRDHPRPTPLDALLLSSELHGRGRA